MHAKRRKMLTKRKRQRKSTQIPLHNLTEQKIFFLKKKNNGGKKVYLGKKELKKENTKKNVHDEKILHHSNYFFNRLHVLQ